MKKKLIFCFFFLISINLFAQDRETLWFARGLQANQKLNNLKLAYKKHPTDENKYNLMIEQAYANIAQKPNEFVVDEVVSVRYKLQYDFGINGLLEIEYIEWDDDMPRPGTAFLKIKNVPKDYCAIIDANGDVDIYYDNDKKYYRIMVFPFNNGLEVYTN